ncbi:phosphoribosyltransferase-like protein [Calycina marina]|uniref:adenine phosphoribosyltransferase n=1 Tax=Calycina marina TaxID=1763456 RepID=A0A9P7YZ88_9HELO|nr:phosphoribosyltransferase-like protein [Calycina marina]
MSTSPPTTTPVAAKSTAPATAGQDASGTERVSSTTAASASQLASEQKVLKASLRHFPDFPLKGILFVDILPLFADHTLHKTLINALKLQVLTACNGVKPDVIVGLDARGFLFGPSLALALGAGFAPVRKQGKLPGDLSKASFKKEYGEDVFEIQNDAIKAGSKVLIVDDIIATGGTAACAGQLVKDLGGEIMGYLFILEIDFLKGRDKLDAPVIILLRD